MEENIIIALSNLNAKMRLSGRNHRYHIIKNTLGILAQN